MMLEAGTGHNGDTNLNMMGAERDICRDVDIISMHPALDLGDTTEAIFNL